MVLPFQPLAMAFDNVNYYVDMPSEMKQQGVEETRLQLLRGEGKLVDTSKGPSPSPVIPRDKKPSLASLDTVNKRISILLSLLFMNHSYTLPGFVSRQRSILN